MQEQQKTDHVEELILSAYFEAREGQKLELEKLSSWLWGAGIAVTIILGFMNPNATVPVALLCMAVAGFVYNSRKKALNNTTTSLLRQMSPEARCRALGIT